MQTKLEQTLSDGYLYRFSSMERLYGQGSLQALSQAHVLVVGLGGVGSWSVESLARSGVGMITLVDFDDICVSNIGRQLPAVTSTVGHMKAEVLQRRCVDINPEIQVNVIDERFDHSTYQKILRSDYSAVIDATDGLDNKCLLLSEGLKQGLQMITVGGSGGKRELAKILVDDLANSHGDRLLAQTRKKLRQDYGFPRRSKFGISCVFSCEEQFYPDGCGGVTQDPSYRPQKPLDCSAGLGTASFVTGSFGLRAAALAVEAILSLGQILHHPTKATGDVVSNSQHGR